MTDDVTPLQRVTAFVDGWPELSGDTIIVLTSLDPPGTRITLTNSDLRAVLAERGQLAAAIERTTAQMREYATHGSGTVNVRQVIGLLSPTWPDGNYESPAPDRCRSCEHPFDPADTRFDGHARHGQDPWCRACIDRCHEGDVGHRCPICTPKLP